MSMMQVGTLVIFNVRQGGTKYEVGSVSENYGGSIQGSGVVSGMLQTETGGMVQGTTGSIADSFFLPAAGDTFSIVEAVVVTN